MKILLQRKPNGYYYYKEEGALKFKNTGLVFDDEALLYIEDKFGYFQNLASFENIIILKVEK